MDILDKAKELANEAAQKLEEFSHAAAEAAEAATAVVVEKAHELEKSVSEGSLGDKLNAASDAVAGVANKAVDKVKEVTGSGSGQH